MRARERHRRFFAIPKRLGTLVAVFLVAACYDSPMDEGTPGKAANSTRRAGDVLPPDYFEPFNGSTLDPVWVKWDGFALQHPTDTPNHAVFGMLGSEVSISFPAGQEHNQWWNKHAQIVRPYLGSGSYEIRINSGFTGTQQVGLVFQKDPSTYLQFMLYATDHVHAYVERFALVGGVLHKMTVTGTPLGVPVPSAGPFYVRVTVTDNVDPTLRSWNMAWSQTGSNWIELFDDVFEGQSSSTNIGTINQVGFFAGNQPTLFSAFNARIDHFSFTQAPPAMEATVTDLAARGSNGQIELWWSPMQSAQSYAVYSVTSNGNVLIAHPAATSLTIGGVTNGTKYTFFVAPIVSGVQGAASHNVTAVPHVVSSWTGLPTQGLVLSLSAGELAYALDDNEPVAQWANAVGARIAATSPVGTAPTFVESAINGLPAVRFDGTEFLSLPEGFQDFTAGTTLFVVMKPTALQSGFKILALGNGPNQQNIVLGRAGSTSGYQFFTNNSGGAVEWFNTGSGLVTGEASLISVIQQAGVANGLSDAQIAKNGTVLAGKGVFVPPVTTRGTNYIGKSYWNDGKLEGDVAEIILYNRTLNATDQQTVRTYLIQKYNLNAPPPLSVPGGVAAQGLDGSVALSWNPVTGASGYRVRRASTQTGAYTQIAEQAGTTFNDVNVVNGQTYYYVVAAYNTTQETANSSQVSATPHAAPSPNPNLPGAGLILALDAEALTVGLSPGQPVILWSDGSAAGSHATATGSSAPTLASNAIGGKPAVRFDGVNDFMSLASGFRDFTAGMSLYVVLRPTVLQNGMKLLALGNGAGQDNIVLGRAGSTAGYQFFNNNGSGAVQWFNTSAGLTAGEASLVSVIQQPGTGSASTEVARNAVALGSGITFTPPNVTRAMNYIGKSYWNDGLFQGDVAEVILYNRTLSSAEQQGVRAYLAQKYAITLGVTPPPPLEAPSTVSAQGNNASVALSWSGVTGATGYRVHRSTTPSGTTSQIADVTGNTFTDNAVTNGATYYYTVSAYDATRQSVMSTQVSATPVAPAQLNPLLPSAGLMLALDAENIQLANGLPVSTWVDASPAGKHATASGAPVVVYNAIGGKRAVRFDGVDDFLTLPSGFQDFTAGISLYVVMRPTALQSGFKIVALGNGGGQENVVLGRAGSTAGYQFFTNNSTNNVQWFNTATGFVAGEASLVSLIQQAGSANSSTQAVVARNGVSLGGQAVYVPSIATRSLNYIGRSYWNDGMLQGDIAEIVLYNRNLTAQEQTNVRSYFAQKYGLTVQ